MTTIELQHQTSRPVINSNDAAEHFGLSPLEVANTPPGALPFAIHNTLTATSTFSSREFSLVPFIVEGHEFYILQRPAEEAWSKIGLRGHKVIDDAESRLDILSQALGIIASRPNTLDLVRRFLTTFIWVETSADDSGEPPLTSCSLPDLPLAAFVSDMAQRHIPPITVAKTNSARLLAENIYHESVHQLVNYRILTEELFIPDFDSRTSPRIPIAWRKNSIKRNQAWELDRVLHAATVYSQLLDWRLHELKFDFLTDEERSSITTAALESVDSSNYLSDALCQHIDYFTPSGALFVGRLAQSIEQRTRLLRELTQSDATGAAA